MAYYVEVDGANVRFPAVCSACCGPGPLMAMERDFHEATGFYVVAYTTRNTVLSYPTCGPCLSKATKMTLGAWALMLLPWGIMCGIPFAFRGDDRPLGEIKAATVLLTLSTCLAIAGVLTGIGLLFYRAHFLRNLRLVHTTRKGVYTFASHRADYARAFAEANDAVVEERSFFFRFA